MSHAKADSVIVYSLFVKCVAFKIYNAFVCVDAWISNILVYYLTIPRNFAILGQQNVQNTSLLCTVEFAWFDRFTYGRRRRSNNGQAH